MEHIEKALARAREMRSSRKASAESEPRPQQPNPNGVAPDYTETAVSPSDLRKASHRRLIAGDVGHPVADVYRLARAQILQRMKRLNIGSLAVTGARHDDGVTTTAANLAISIAL